MEQIEDGSTEELQFLFSKFEDNLSNDFGLRYLIDALECAQKVIMGNNTETKYRRAKNLINAYGRKVIERATTLCNSSIPDIRQLEYSKRHLEIFKDYGFNDELSSFDTIKSEVDSQYAKAFISDLFGKPLQDITPEDKTRLRNILALM